MSLLVGLFRSTDKQSFTWHRANSCASTFANKGKRDQVGCRRRTSEESELWRRAEALRPRLDFSTTPRRLESRPSKVRSRDHLISRGFHPHESESRRAPRASSTRIVRQAGSFVESCRFALWIPSGLRIPASHTCDALCQQDAAFVQSSKAFILPLALLPHQKMIARKGQPKIMCFAPSIQVPPPTHHFNSLLGPPINYCNLFFR